MISMFVCKFYMFFFFLKNMFLYMFLSIVVISGVCLLLFLLQSMSSCDLHRASRSSLGFPLPKGAAVDNRERKQNNHQGK